MKTVGVILKEMAEYRDAERRAYLDPLIKALSPVSHGSLFDFQNKWDTSCSFGEFRAAQEKLISECVEFECSRVGQIVREQYKLKLLTMDTKVGHKGEHE